MFDWLMPLCDAEGAIGAASGAAEVSESPSVEAGAGEAPAAGNAPVADPTVPDVTQQESFAARLKEATGKVESQYAPYKETASQVERIAKAAGFANVSDYLTALDRHMQEQQIAEQARKMQIDEDTYRQFFQPVTDDLQKTKSELEQLRSADVERRVMADYERLKGQYSDFESVQDKVFDLASERGYTLEEAYKLITWESRVEAAKQEGQAAAIQAIKANGDTSTGPVGGDAPSQTFDFTKLSAEKRKEYYEKAKRGELKSLR